MSLTLSKPSVVSALAVEPLPSDPLGLDWARGFVVRLTECGRITRDMVGKLIAKRETVVRAGPSSRIPSACTLVLGAVGTMVLLDVLPVVGDETVSEEVRVQWDVQGDRSHTSSRCSTGLER